MAGYKRPTFDDEAPVAEAPAPAVETAPAPATKAGGYKRPTFTDEPVAAAKPEKGSFAEFREKKKAELMNDTKDTMDTNKSMFNGLMFGFGDRIRAATGIGVEGEDYDERLKNALAERAAYNKENPIKHFFTEGLPGVVSGAAAMAPVKAAVGAVAPGLVQYASGSGALPAAVRVAGEAATGAGFGALSGAGSAQPGKMAEGAKDGAIIGAGTTLAMKGAGKVLGGAADMLTPAFQTVMRWAGVTDPTKWAQKKLVSDLLESGETPESVVRKLKEMSNEGAWRPQADDFVGPPQAVPAKPVVLADALPPKVLGTLKATAGGKGGGAEIIQGRLGQRAVEAPDRIANDIATNISERTGASAEATRIITDRANASKPLYDQAFARGTPQADEVLPFFDTPLKKSLFRDVEGAARGAGEPFTGRMTINPKTQEFEIKEVPSVADLHEMRRHLSDVKQKMWDNDQGKYVGWGKIGGENYNIGRINKAMDELTSKIEDLTGGSGGSYATARKIYSDESSVLDALRSGQSILKTRPEDVAIEFRKLGSEAERDAYRAGISSVLTDKAGSTSSGATILKNIFGNKNIRSKLDEIYPNDGARALFPKQMAAEQKMQDTTKILAPGTVKHDFLESGGEASLPAALANFMAGRPVAGAANAARFIAGQADKMNPLYGEQLARLGMMTLPEAESFAAQVSRQANNPFSRAAKTVMGGLSAMGSATPYVAGGLAARQDAGPLSQYDGGN